MAKKASTGRAPAAFAENKEKAPEMPRRVKTAERPTSPHLSVYRWQMSNTLSILHRITGAGLLLGFFLLSLWIIAAAMGPHAYDSFQVVVLSPFGKLILAGFTLAFYYHLLNGFRHLMWDSGYGLDVKTADLTGYLVLAGTLALSLLTWWDFIAKFLE